MESAGAPGKCHISEATLNCLNNAYEVEEGTPNEFLSRVVNYKIKVQLNRSKIWSIRTIVFSDRWSMRTIEILSKKIFSAESKKYVYEDNQFSPIQL